MTPLTPDQVRSLLSAGRHMGRERYQTGRVEEVGKRVKKWRGYYYVYALESDGTDRRRKKTITLGLKSEMTKSEAKAKLLREIEKSSMQGGGALAADTLRSFWESRYIPMYQGGWAPSTKSGLINTVKIHIMGKFGDVELREFDQPKSSWRFRFQVHLNELAEDGYSKSIVAKTRIYLKAILNEAVEQEYISRNPARKLILPDTRAEDSRALMIPEVVKLVGQLQGRDRLIVRLFVECGLRPGELFVGLSR